MFKKEEILRFETELSEEMENVKRIAEIIKVRMDNLPSSSDGAYEEVGWVEQSETQQFMAINR